MERLQGQVLLVAQQFKEACACLKSVPQLVACEEIPLVAAAAVIITSVSGMLEAHEQELISHVYKVARRASPSRS
jgi:hypothetical protein